MEITGKRGPEGVVKAVCTSEKKGVEKHSVPEGHFLKDFGIEEMHTLVNGIVR